MASARIGSRVRTADPLLACALYPNDVRVLRRAGAHGTVTPEPDVWGVRWVRHDDGSEAPYDDDELTILQESERDFVKELSEAVTAAGGRFTFDSGRSYKHPCTFCGKSDSPRDLVTIGRYGNGDDLTRPVCERCRPIGQRCAAMLRKEGS